MSLLAPGITALPHPWSLQPSPKQSMSSYRTIRKGIPAMPGPEQRCCGQSLLMTFLSMPQWALCMLIIGEPQNSLIITAYPSPCCSQRELPCPINVFKRLPLGFAESKPVQCRSQCSVVPQELWEGWLLTQQQAEHEASAGKVTRQEIFQYH